VEEKRILIKQIISHNAALNPDYENTTLTVVLYSLSTPDFNRAAHKLANLLNKTQTTFPGTNVRLVYKTTAYSIHKE
jgi:hypothetical protein